MSLDLTGTVIESERLRLVPVSPKYREDMFREFTDEITTWMCPPTPKDISETDAFIAKCISEAEAGNELVVAITDKSSGEFIGCCGLHKISSGIPELGIWTKKSSHGNKYGREAVTALKTWVDANVTYEYISYPVAKENIGSRKIAESLGGMVVREFVGKTGRGTPMDEVEYNIPRA